ncbi:MAG: YebC/PmpR family DNA-binding transcriptional regulator [Firmicutes bacterium]|nr:YebC/PmpR family DNA-binding transcriptional regulator [Bacillota bacterium]MCL5057612.1 YebC/PmpR family DNA-binding transcriptional regulator [Actinomycetota bacterium]
MSGHSKWATIKRKKAKVDAARGRVFTQLAKEILLAAKQGGGDPDGNLRLKNAIAKAKEANIPNDNIQRAIMKGTGELGGGSYEEILYEGYGPGGVAVMVEATTNNRNRTAGEVRHLFSKNGGNLGESGCVAWMFEKKGMIVIEKDTGADEDDLMMAALDSGAEDVRVEDDVFEIITDPGSFETLRDGLEEKGYQLAEAQVSMLPTNTVKIEGDQAEQMLKLLDSLEELDDVDGVYTNFDMD